jgi:phosphoribosylformylglycinamidine synthase
MTQLSPKKNTLEMHEPDVSLELAREFGLSAEEYDLILERLDRVPTYTELGIFSVMWSEHCSYKSSRLHLKKFPVDAPWVIQGPGENAGVIDIGDNQAAVFKMESHNHPSFIEPFQGAATGVGGIMRDVFTMGARPIANVNALRFGAADHPKTRSLVQGVVAGISHYGNCMGVPTVAGETNFHSSYNGNILVNAMTVGLADHDSIYYARGAGVGQPVVYVGSKTGRDGIHGATMASAEFNEDAEEKRPTVQVGDPFTEKLLLEACLELMQEDVIICIQDMGAAGLTSSSVEIADKGEIGVHLRLDDVPQREIDMSPYEIMLSESQERMLMILKPGKEDIARAIFEKWDLDFAVIGETTDDRHLRLTMYGKEWCNIPVPPLVDDAPMYDRPQSEPPKPKPLPKEEAFYGDLPDGVTYADAIYKIMGSPNMASKRWIWEQYDSLVRGQTVFSPGIAQTQVGRSGDAALVRVKGHKSLAITSDCTPRYCYANPYEGGKQVVAESYRNISAVGAKPLAVTNNLNFANPERPDIMAQFVGCIEGMAEACKQLEYPVISGNVSLYNETDGQGIFPTPVIGGVGLIDDDRLATGLSFSDAGLSVYLVGGDESHIGQSVYLQEVHGLEAGDAPSVDLDKEKNVADFVRSAILDDHVQACHDVSDGGVICALAEMCLASDMGMTIEGGDDLRCNASYWFSEAQAKFIIISKNDEALEGACKNKNIELEKIATTDYGKLTLPDDSEIIMKKLAFVNEDWLPSLMKGDR